MKVHEQAAVGELAHVSAHHRCKAAAGFDDCGLQRAEVLGDNGIDPLTVRSAQVTGLAQIHVVEEQLSLAAGPGLIGYEHGLTVRLKAEQRLWRTHLCKACPEVVLAEHGKRGGVEPAVAQLDLDLILALVHQVAHIEGAHINEPRVVGPVSQKLDVAQGLPVDEHPRVTQGCDAQLYPRGGAERERAGKHMVAMIAIVPCIILAVIVYRSRYPLGVVTHGLHHASHTYR